MPELLDHVAYLSQEIGPRPAGTEEEQQAALYITEQMQKEAGLSATIEDFGGAPNSEAPRVLCCLCALVVSALALFFPVLGVPSIVVALVAALLFAAEAFDRPLLSRAFARGVSQNVVAKYEPGFSPETGGSRRRKVIVVARYDSGKVRAELNGPLARLLPVVQWTELGAMIALPILLVVRNVFFLNDTGAAAMVLNVLVVVALVPLAVMLAFSLIRKLAAYNEAANCNAAGTAVLLETACRVGRGRVSEAELAAREEAVIHGEAAAREAGLVPEGAQIVYESANVKPPEPAPQTPEARLAAAKAAVAALSGKPVGSGAYSSDLAQNLVQVKEPPLASPSDEDYREVRDETREALTTIPPDTMQAALANAEASVQQEAEGAEDAHPAEQAFPAQPTRQVETASDGVPDWFKKAQEKAKKPHADNRPVQRSRYASALDAAVNESEGHFAEANMAVEKRLEQGLESKDDGIQEVKAPRWGSAAGDGQAGPASENSEIGGTPLVGDAPQGRGPAAAGPSSGDPDATTAMAPIDVSDLDLGDMPVVGDVPMPSFLDPRKVQEESRAQFQDEHRTGNRVDVTGAPIDASGRIAVAEAPGSASEPGKRLIELPDIGVSAANLAPIAELPKQRAPLAEVETSAKSAAKSLLTMLPSIDVGTIEADGGAGASRDASEGAPDPADKKAALRSVLPSLSGAIRRADVAEGSSTNVSAAGSFAPAGATGAFAPVGDELLENVDPDDIYVDDADDSAYDENITETGAYAGPGYVEMPKSRVHRLFGRFRRKKEENEDPSPREWLDVDESFDARTVGAERGGWESFRDDDGSFEEDAFPSSSDEFADDFHPENGDDAGEYASDDRRPWQGGAFSSGRIDEAESAQALFDEVEPSADFPSPDVSDELQQVYQFRNPDVNTEVWFVALGSELSDNAGMRAFLSEHQQDLRGSIIVDIDALGAGELCMIEREGRYRTAKTSSRMKRYVKKASQATGLNVGSAQLLWEDSAASIAVKQGYQAMHLAGMDGAKPAFYAQANDMMENIDEETLRANADFVMELLKNI